MFSTKEVVNQIYKELKPKEQLVMHIQNLLLFQRPAYSAIFIGVFEVLFLIGYFTNMSTASTIVLNLAVFSIVYVISDLYPSIFNKALSFEIKNPDPNAPNRMRSLSEVAAYLTTILSFGLDIVKAIFLSPESTSIVRTVLNATFLFFLFFVTWVIGDFWFIFILIHIVFVLPGILLQPKIYNFIFSTGNEYSEEKQSDGNEDASPTTLEVPVTMDFTRDQ